MCKLTAIENAALVDYYYYYYLIIVVIVVVVVKMQSEI